MNILVRKNNQERGPYTEAELRERLKSGVFSASDLGQVEGEIEWKPLSEILLASILGAEKSTEARAATPGGIATYSWLRQPKIIGGAIVLLLLIFGGINWLNKASEKRRENAIAARQEAAMEQAQKQEAALLQQEQEQAAKARQAQLDQVKQIMAMSEKAQRDYQEKQKREQEERQKAEQAKIDAEQRKKEEGNKELEKRRLAAEAKQKAVEAEFLKNRPKPVAAATPSNSPSGVPNITLDSIPLGPFPKQRENVIVTDDGSRVMVIAAQGSRVQAVVDGQPGPVCRNVRVRKESGDSSKLYGWPPFSPDMLRCAYIAELDAGKECVVVDGVQSPICDKVDWLVFAPKGHHFAYLEVQRGAGESGRGTREKFSVVDNGKRGPVFDLLMGGGKESANPRGVFSEDGEHLGYVGMKASARRNIQRVVLDGREEGQEHASIKQLALSRDGKHVAYIATDYIANNTGGGFEQDSLIWDGKADRACYQITQMTLSSDGSRCVYVGQTPARNTGGAWAELHKSDSDSDQYYVVDNGKVGRTYDGIPDVQVSANGQRAAYIASSRAGARSDYFVVDNGKASTAYDECSQLQISDDGSLLSFRTNSAQGMLLVVNGQEFGPFYSIDREVVYSADGKHWGCVVHATDSSDSAAFVTDGVTHPMPKDARYKGPITLEFRPDKGWFASSSMGEESSSFEVESATTDSRVPTQIIYSRDRQHVAKVFSSNQGSSSANQQVMLGDKPVGPVYLRVHHVQLSDDGRHVAFIGMYNGTGGTAFTHANVDGEEGPAWMQINGLAMTPDGKHIAYSAEERSQSGSIWHLVVDGFVGPTFENILGEGYWEKVRRISVQPDGSVTFLAVLKGQLSRYIYPAEALKFMPTIGQTENVTPGPRVLQRFPSNYVSRHVVVAQNGTLYGTLAQGGDYGHGVFFSIKNNGTAAKIIHSFYGNDEDGNLDAGAYGEVFLGQNGIVYGQAGTIIFRYDPAKGEYGVVAKGVDSQSHLKGVFADGSLFFEGGNKYANENNWAIMPKDGSDLEPVGSGNKASEFVAIGPDDAVYSATADSLLRKATVYSPSTVLHKFLDSPQDAKRPDQYVTFDPTGVVYGSAQSGDARRSIVYRVNRDGSDYRVLLGQSQNFLVGSVVAGDDAALYGHFTHEKQSGLCRLSTQGGQPEFLGIKGDSGQFQDSAYANSMRPMVFHKSAVYHSTQDTLVKVQLPRTDEAARLSPVVTIKSVAAPPLGSVDPVSFTASSGETIPNAKAPSTHANAAIWQPPPPGSTLAVVSQQSPPRAQNRVTSSKGSNPPNATFGNEAPSIGALGQEEASRFAMSTVSAMSAGDVSTLASYYGSQVDYQDKGMITNDAVQNEFQQYFARWPQTNWQLAGAVTVQPMGPSRCQITFPVSFEAANPATNKRATGSVRQTMILEPDSSGAWKIVMERQTITSKKSDESRRRSDREKIYKGKPADDWRRNIPPNIPWQPSLPHP